MTVKKEKYARNGIHMGMNGGFVLLSDLGDAGKFPFLISIEGINILGTKITNGELWVACEVPLDFAIDQGVVGLVSTLLQIWLCLYQVKCFEEAMVQLGYS